MKYIHSSPATATTSRRRAVKHVPLGTPYSHSSSIDIGFCGNRHRMYTHYVYLVYSHCCCCCAACVRFGALYDVLFSGESSFVFLCCDTRMYRRFRGCPVVIDIELSVSAWYHKNRRVLLRARRLLLVLLLTAESKERRLAVCGITSKPASNGAETNVPFRRQKNSPHAKHPRLKKAFL